MTKPTLKDVVDGTPEGLAAVQGAMERSAGEMDKINEIARLRDDLIAIAYEWQDSYELAQYEAQADQIIGLLKQYKLIS